MKTSADRAVRSRFARASRSLVGARRRPTIVAFMLLAVVLVAGWPSLVEARAGVCDRAAVAKAIDDAGAALRRLNGELVPRLKARMRELQVQRGWRDDEYEDAALAAVHDARAGELDRRANELLEQLDRVGQATWSTAEECAARLAELRSTADALQATMRAKSNHLLTRLDTLLGAPRVGATAKSEAVRPSRPVPASPATAAPEVKPPRQNPAPAKTGVPVPGTQSAGQPLPPDAPWVTSTEPAGPALPPPQPLVAQPLPRLPKALPGDATASAPLPAQGDGFAMDEIRAASRDFFGSVSTGLASVLERAFSIAGQPTGYILGSEGGGAFLAGLRFGDGMLYLKDGRRVPIFWHGPSIGYDIGAAGSKVLVLIYNAREPEHLFTAFSGVDGSAFLIGGVGLTFLSNGRINMAPIRSGIGVRLGANIGYLRFTARPTWNPF